MVSPGIRGRNEEVTAPRAPPPGIPASQPFPPPRAQHHQKLLTKSGQLSPRSHLPTSPAPRGDQAPCQGESHLGLGCTETGWKERQEDGKGLAIQGGANSDLAGDSGDRGGRKVGHGDTAG